MDCQASPPPELPCDLEDSSSREITCWGGSIEFSQNLWEDFFKPKTLQPPWMSSTDSPTFWLANGPCASGEKGNPTFLEVCKKKHQGYGKGY